MILHSQIIGEGYPFVILHGFLGMSDNWKTLGKKFAEKGYQVHLLDQRNHGRSFHSDEFSYQHLALDLFNYYNHHQLENCVLLGHSMGGKTAMHFAIDYPDKITKLIVADISSKVYPPHHQDILAALNSLDFSVIKSRKDADEVLSQKIRQIGVRQFLLKNLYWEEKGKLGLRANLRVLTKEYNEIGKALPQDQKFQGDTLFIRGEDSGYLDVLDEVLLPKQFPNCEIKTVKEAGHWLHAEKPVEFFDKVMTFLNN